MKKFLVIVSTLISTFACADIEVKNHTQYPIMFEMYWKGKAAYNCSYIFNPTCWTEHAVWPDEIKGGQSLFKAGELWNEKNRYIIKAKTDGNWNTVIDKLVNEAGNRVVNVFYSPDPNTGEQIWKIETALK